MPRQPRLDAPGLLQHIMVRGIERTKIFRDDKVAELLDINLPAGENIRDMHNQVKCLVSAIMREDGIIYLCYQPPRPRPVNVV